MGRKWKVRRFSCDATGRKAPPGNASAGLANTWWYPASVLQSAAIALHASTTNDRSAVNRFWPGPNNALTFTFENVTAPVPASLTST